MTDTDREDPQAPLLITQGDVCGIGPEIIVKAFSASESMATSTVVLGELTVMQQAAARFASDVEVIPLDSLAQSRPAAKRLQVLNVPGMPDGLAELPLGQVRSEAGRAAAACIRHAVHLVRSGQGSGIVTAPIHKEALSAAGVPFPGHTEMLQSLAAREDGTVPPVRMMLANDELRTVLVTIHMSLRRAIDAVTHDAVLSTIRIAHASLQAFGISVPRIAVAGLNPHAGEGGLFGDEEVRVIAPAIEAARAEGILASGPYPPDTVFMRARHAPGHPGAFDVVVAMTHDHGLIPVKYLGVEDGVNVTLGLPFVRTSPDHGTAFDIAGQGKADPSSLLAAWRMAKTLSR